MKILFLSLILSILAAACSSSPQITTDPYRESFFEKARLLMSNEEIDIYKHLPDTESRAEFIDEFWKKRDPNPETEENEVREEFEERIAYANRWFHEGKGKDRGWDTARGRILLQLGFPDERHWGEVDRTSGVRGAPGSLASTRRVPMERWHYLLYRMTLVFIGNADGQLMGDSEGFGQFRLVPGISNMRKLTEALKKEKALLNRGFAQKSRYFKFTADYEPGRFIIEIPIKNTGFEEKGSLMNAAFQVEIHVYRDYKKVHEIEELKKVTWEKDKLLSRKTIDFELPYELKETGGYYFDIIITEELSATKYRNFCKYNWRKSSTVE